MPGRALLPAAFALITLLLFAVSPAGAQQLPPDPFAGDGSVELREFPDQPAKQGGLITLSKPPVALRNDVSIREGDVIFLVSAEALELDLVGG